MGAPKGHRSEGVAQGNDGRVLGKGQVWTYFQSWKERVNSALGGTVLRWRILPHLEVNTPSLLTPLNTFSIRNSTKGFARFNKLYALSIHAVVGIHILEHVRGESLQTYHGSKKIFYKRKYSSTELPPRWWPPFLRGSSYEKKKIQFFFSNKTGRLIRWDHSHSIQNVRSSLKQELTKRKLEFYAIW